jgi:hypothetical protein
MTLGSVLSMTHLSLTWRRTCRCHLQVHGGMSSITAEPRDAIHVLGLTLLFVQPPSDGETGTSTNREYVPRSSELESKLRPKHMVQFPGTELLMVHLSCATHTGR